MEVYIIADLRSPNRKFRPEIEGVRAVAAFLVAIYHIWIGSVSGGVDVFFIVSGYLITTSLLSKMEREGRINLLDYLLGLVKRLFPIAFTVLFVTALISILLMPQGQWKQIISEILSSAFYFQNWQLATNTVDYLAQNNEASPLQHFWALSIQGQFYVVWPLVILLTYFIARKILKMPVRKTLLGVLGTIFAASIAYSIHITAENQPWAYFDTFARVWEFSLGGILALLIPYLVFKKPVSTIMGWLGLAIVCLTGVLLPVSSVFPGYAALLPTTGVILVIIAAENSSRFGVDKLLGSKPFLYFGSISYGFYLWHWPLLIFYYAYFRTETVSILGGISILLVTVVLSIVSVKIIETPVRIMNVKQSKRKLLKAIVTFMLPVILVNGLWGLVVNQKLNVFGEYSVEDYPGARAISDNINPTKGVPPTPSAISIKEELPSFYADTACFSFIKEFRVAKCSRGQTENPEYTIALVGGSHSGHWFPALEVIAEKQNVQIDIYNKDGCRFTAGDFDGQLHESCVDWNEKVLQMLIDSPPDLVFTTANNDIGDKIPTGYLEQWKKLEGITEVFAIRDNPRMGKDTPLCVEQAKNLNECSELRKESLSELPPWENTEGIPSNVTFADFSEYFCDEEKCLPVIGNVIVYRDKHHLSTLYSQTMAPALEKHIVEALQNLKN